MIRPGIEDDIRPETVNEVLLLNRISELRRIIWELDAHAPRYEPFLKDPNEVEMTIPHLSYRLNLAARADVETKDYGLRIMARTYGPASLGYGTYMDGQELQALKLVPEARLLEEVHKRCLHGLAKLIREKGIEAVTDLQPPSE